MNAGASAGELEAVLDALMGLGAPLDRLRPDAS